MSIAKKLKNSRGFTLVELMIVVVIIGILAALAIYGVRKYVSNAKTAEANMALGRMSKDAAATYEAEKMGGDVIQIGQSRGISRTLCATAHATVPAALVNDEGMKYQPQPLDWQTTPEAEASWRGWTCLKYSMEQPIYFTYDYRSSQTDATTAAAPNDGFTVSAQANMDGVLKILSLSGRLQADATGNLIMTLTPSIAEESAAAANTPTQVERWTAAEP